MIGWGYVAGFFDGEGSAGVYQTPTKGPNSTAWSVAFINTHRPVLDQIRVFLGAGTIRERKCKKPGLSKKPVYSLVVSRIDDLRRILPPLIERCQIKADVLVRVLEHVANKKPATNWGKLATLGPKEIRRLYWEEGMSAGAIGDRAGGVGVRGVTNYMKRHKIPTRSRSESNRLSYLKGRRVCYPAR
jgi:hypothetical protein